MPDDRTAEVVEAMARAIHSAYPGAWVEWDELVKHALDGDRLAPRGLDIARIRARAALRALPPGYVVTTVPGEMAPVVVPHLYDEWNTITSGGLSAEDISNGYADGHNACRTATLAAAVRVEDAP